MIPNDEIHRLIGAMAQNILTSPEFSCQMMGLLWKLPFAERHIALDELSTHANEYVRDAASELKIFMHHEQLSRNFEYVRENSPLRPGMRLELFGGYDYYSSNGNPWWLNGRDCYRGTFLGFGSCGENT